MTLQKHLRVSDHYSGLHVLETDDLGRTWRGPTAVPELDWETEPASVGEGGGATIAVADVTDEKSRGRGMGLMGAAMGLGFIFGPGIGGYLSRFGHGVPFLAASALNLFTCVLAAVLLRESLGGRPPAAAGEIGAALPLSEMPGSSEVPAPEPPIFPRPSRALASPLLPT